MSQDGRFIKLKYIINTEQKQLLMSKIEQHTALEPSMLKTI